MFSPRFWIQSRMLHGISLSHRHGLLQSVTGAWSFLVFHVNTSEGCCSGILWNIPQFQFISHFLLMRLELQILREKVLIRSAFSSNAIGKPMISTSLITGGHSLTMYLTGFSTRKSLFFLSICDVLEAVSKSSSNSRWRGVKDHLLEGGRPRNLWAYVKNHLCN